MHGSGDLELALASRDNSCSACMSLERRATVGDGEQRSSAEIRVARYTRQPGQLIKAWPSGLGC